VAGAKEGTHAAATPAKTAPSLASTGRAWFWVGGILAGAAVFYGGLLVGSNSEIPGNTNVLGVQIGGLSTAEATAILQQELGPKSESPIAISAYDNTALLVPLDAGMSFDAAATAAAASSRAFNPLELLGRLVAAHAVDPVVTVNQETLRLAIEDFSATVVTTPVEPTIAYDGLTPTYVYGVPGRGVDVDASMGRIDAAYLNSSRVELVVVSVPMQISDETVDSTVSGIATSAISGPVRVEVGEARSSISPEAIAQALHLEPEGALFVPVLDGDFLHDVIEQDLKLVEGGAKDATFRIVGDVPVVVPAVLGQGVSAEDLGAAVLSAMEQTGDARVARVDLSASQLPDLTTEEAFQLGVKERISTFTQNVPTIEYMQHNLARAAKYIDGMILMPGETFSMNETTENHNPDPAKGYMEGYAIGPSGVFQKVLGGGLSAATTTTWSAAFYGGLEPVQVQQHSRYISRYQPGIEATVAWGYFDMQFKNNTPYAIFITATTDDVSMTVSMYSTKIWDDITSEIGGFYASVKPPKIYNDTDACAAQTGIAGFSVDYKRLFWKFGEVEKTEDFSASYLAGPEVICGPDPKKPTKKPSGSGSGSGGGSGSGSGSGSANPSSSNSGSADPSSSGSASGSS
jgi:vancomycin resistance protein YoaR